ncbi:MAG: alanine--glyoxylate aminotransferase family protein [Chloroflexota bacterium]|nr:alanine--glyoxylate aminotransferase family protein [Dehalococcoidia bacterium]MDW8254048.1 alanine--glyoxylate aminotransferase family protein [Chloroflexota bacterium]
MNLRIPGPTPCPEEVLMAMTKQMVDHRGPEFKDILLRVTERLKTFFQTKNDVVTLTAAGTGGLEAAIVNFLSPGETVLAVSIGVFGDRFAKIAETYGATVKRLRFEDGEAADPDQIAAALAADPSIRAVTVTHNETSTGVTNDLAAIAKVVKAADKLILVDAVSSLTAIDLPVDALGLDVVVSGSQKGWMVPPGLTFLSVSERGWEANANAKMPRFYLDVREAKKSLDKGQTPWTPAISVFYALDVALDLMLAEGLPAIFERHRRVAERTRAGVKELGLRLLAKDERYASNSVTAVWAPDGVEVKALRAALRERGVVVAGGQGALDGKIFRIGHLGYVRDADIEETLHALREVLPKVGYSAAAATA